MPANPDAAPEAVELKPCPFCGDRGPEISCNSPRRHYVACTAGTDCITRGPICETEADAIAAWNRRAIAPTSAADAAEVARLRAEVERLTAALKAVFAVGDGWGGDNTVEKPKGTTGDGHARCRQIARTALGGAS